MKGHIYYLCHMMLFKLGLRKKSAKPAIQELLDLLPIVFCAALIIGAIKWLFHVKSTTPFIWLTSPNGKHYKFGLWLGLRILRKRKYWSVTQTEPILSRKQALKRLLFGIRV